MLHHWKKILCEAINDRILLSVDSSFVFNTNECNVVLIFIKARNKDLGELQFISDICLSGVSDLVMSDMVEWEDSYAFQVARVMSCNVRDHAVYDFWKESQSLTNHRNNFKKTPFKPAVTENVKYGF